MWVRPLIGTAAVALVLVGCGGTAALPPAHPSARTPTTAASAPATSTPAPIPTTAPASTDSCHRGGLTYCVLNPAVTQATIRRTICVSGWTATVRPPESYTETLKRQQIATEGLSGSLGDYEEDHRMPLELGGAPSARANLSPEYPSSPNPKDSNETRLKDEVCAGQLTLLQAQQQLVTQWLAPYPRYRSQPAQASSTGPASTPNLCGAPSNPWGYNFCGGTPVEVAPSSLCDYFDCISSFWVNTKGYVTECRDGTFSHSGGRDGACSYHGGELRPLDS